MHVSMVCVQPQTHLYIVVKNQAVSPERHVFPCAVVRESVGGKGHLVFRHVTVKVDCRASMGSVQRARSPCIAVILLTVLKVRLAKAKKVEKVRVERPVHVHQHVIAHLDRLVIRVVVKAPLSLYFAVIDPKSVPLVKYAMTPPGSVQSVQMLRNVRRIVTVHKACSVKREAVRRVLSPCSAVTIQGACRGLRATRKMAPLEYVETKNALLPKTVAVLNVSNKEHNVRKSNPFVNQTVYVTVKSNIQKEFAIPRQGHVHLLLQSVRHTVIVHRVRPVK